VQNYTHCDNLCKVLELFDNAQTHLDTQLSTHSAPSMSLANSTDASVVRLRFQHEADTDVLKPETTRSPVEQTDGK